MTLPKNISRDHLLEAIKKIDTEGVPANRASLLYDVAYNNKTYPSRLIVTYANLIANNKPLNIGIWDSKQEAEAFKLLKENGFEIVEGGADFSKVLVSFLKRANTPKAWQTKKTYGTFNGLTIRAGFGMSEHWLALLGKGKQITKGIYPVFLYYKNPKILALAFTTTDTKLSEINWRISPEVREQHLHAVFYNDPASYGSSVGIADYDIDPQSDDFGLDLDQVNKDIIQLTNIYRNILLKKNPAAVAEMLPLPAFQYKDFIEQVKKTPLSFSKDHIVRFVAALCTKPFVILTGLSGSGKTKLAQAFAEWICEKDDQVRIIPVGADWTNREPLLGYPDALSKGDYVLPENGALQLILDAISNPRKPYFLILDEMNLSHVERYFADFLSAMESSGYICLHPDTAEWNNSSIPGRFKLPQNLFVIGTVNIDETTYMFSPKVLDRANVIEFRVTKEEMTGYLDAVKGNVRQWGNIDWKGLTAAGSSMAPAFVQLAAGDVAIPQKVVDLKTMVLSFFEALTKVGAEFGYRSARDILQFAAIVNKMDKDWPVEKVIDAAIMQKLLPRVHGSRRKLEPVLKALSALCLYQEKEAEEYLNSKDVVSGNDKKVKYPLALDKIRRMYQNLLDNSFASYAEA